MKKNNKSWTIKEVADLFLVSESTVRNWCNSDSLASYRTIGGHRRFRSKQIKEFMESNGIDGENVNPEGLSRLE